MTDVEHRVAMFNLAMDRRRQGKPQWAATLDLSNVFHDEALTFEQRRDAIVARIHHLKPYKDALEAVEHPEGDDYYDAEQLVSLIEELSEAEEKDFDYLWNEFYNWADYARVWVRT